MTCSSRGMGTDKVWSNTRRCRTDFRRSTNGDSRVRVTLSARNSNSGGENGSLVIRTSLACQP